MKEVMLSMSGLHVASPIDTNDRIAGDAEVELHKLRVADVELCPPKLMGWDFVL